MSWPDVEVVWIEQESWFSIDSPACRHPEFDVFMCDVLLLIIHPIVSFIRQMSS